MENIRVIRYESIREFADAAKEGAKSFKEETGQNGASATRGEWASNVAKSVEAAHRLAVEGWPEAAARITQRVNEFQPRMRKYIAERPEWIPSMSGEVWDISAYMSGDPDYAFEMVPTEQEVRTNVATLLLGTCFNASVTADEIEFRGSLVMSLVEAFALSGVELEVWSEQHIKPGGFADKAFQHNGVMYSSTAVLVCLKRAGDPVDTQSYAFSTDAGWLRRLTFGLMEGWPKEIRDVYNVYKDGGYGVTRPVTQSKMLGAQMTLDMGQADGWPTYTYMEDYTMWDRAARWVGEQLDKVAVASVVVGARE